ncbi:MAG: hypothetical protein H6591_03180 [Flavobacteriales bacterium]|nr:hypothetical protein [Flavobacteriales bacterium]
MIDLATPYIPLGSSVGEAMVILARYGEPREEGTDEELCYRIVTASFRMAIYPLGDVVGSVWYDDPAGRGFETNRAQKVGAYLMRYGPIQNWELRMDNGWMQYWFNPTDRAQMVYGVDKDVIRFNQYHEIGG